MNKLQKNFEQLMSEVGLKLVAGEKEIEAGSEQISKIFKYVRNGREKDKEDVEAVLK